MKKTLLLAAALLVTAALPAQKRYTLASPDGTLQTTVSVGGELSYDIRLNGRTLLEPSPLSLRLNNGSVWGPDARVAKASQSSVDQWVASPFYRADSSRSLPGNGLGLSLVAAIVKSYDGSISFESSGESGTCFTIHLPAKHDSREQNGKNEGARLEKEEEQS